MEIRKSTKTEQSKIESIHSLAFGNDKGGEIAQLVHDLLQDQTALPIYSLVAVENGKLLGHILFTRAYISTDNSISAQLLGPLAVLPENQDTGVGARLIREGLDLLKASEVDLVFVLGHPDYYPRCGFEPAGKLGFQAPYPIPEKHAGAWMVQELSSEVLGRMTGKVQCCDVFNQPQHWRE